MSPPVRSIVRSSTNSNLSDNVRGDWIPMEEIVAKDRLEEEQKPEQRC
jgi:hypothetical protein